MSEPNLNFIPKEIIQIIFQFTTSIVDFVQFGSVSRLFREFLNLEYPNYAVLNPGQIEKIPERYRLTSIKIISDFEPLRSYHLGYLKKIYQSRNIPIKRLDISNSPAILEYGLIFLDQIPELNLSNCKLTGYGLVRLKLCRKINLTGNFIKDEHTQFLSDYEQIVLDHNVGLTDECLIHFTNCKKLSIVGCNKLTAEALSLVENRMVVFRNKN